jgi:hypothetical protein
VELKEMLAQSEREYSDYVRDQAQLSRQGEADPEFMGMMQRAVEHEDRYWQSLVKTRKQKAFKRQHRMRYLRQNSRYAETLLPLPPTPVRQVPSEVEQDARLFERGADWLEQHKWTKGWLDRVVLPDGRVVEARCALGSILAAVPGLEDCDGTPSVSGGHRLNRALGRIDLEMDSVVNYNDGPAESLQEVARYLRGLAYQIREFGS